MKFNLETLSNSLSIFFNRVAHFSIIIVALVVGFIVGHYYDVVFDKVSNKNAFKKVYTMKETSIALNEKNQILIIDKTDGSYRTYEDSVGLKIFDFFANKLYVKEKSGK